MEADRILQDSAVRHLAWDPEIASGDICIAVRDGVVTLTGFVRSSQEKLAAESLVRILPGVRAIANDIQIAAPVDQTDPEIARGVLAAMADHAGVPKLGITVTVRDGKVALDGSVDWQFQKESAETVVAGVPGVKSVINRVDVNPPISVSEIRAITPENVRSEIDGRTVRLSGCVSSWEERSALERAVWSSPGVSRVENRVAVAPH